jgi:hypothetical protein
MSLNQSYHGPNREYTVDFLRRFRMEDYRMMATPMVTNLKNVVTSYLELVDPRIYKKWIGSLMYLFNRGPNICFVVNTLSRFMVESK